MMLYPEGEALRLWEAYRNAKTEEEKKKAYEEFVEYSRTHPDPEDDFFG